MLPMRNVSLLIKKKKKPVMIFWSKAMSNTKQIAESELTGYYWKSYNLPTRRRQS